MRRTGGEERKGMWAGLKSACLCHMMTNRKIWHLCMRTRLNPIAGEHLNGSDRLRAPAFAAEAATGEDIMLLHRSLT